MSRAIQGTGILAPHKPALGSDVSANEVWEANLHCRYKAYLRLSASMAPNAITKACAISCGRM